MPSKGAVTLIRLTGATLRRCACACLAVPRSRFPVRAHHVFPALIAMGLCVAQEARAGWTTLAHTAPGSVSLMLLLTDGTVIAQNSATSSAWYRLTPDIHGSYVNGTWTTLSAMHDTRLYFSADILQSGKLFVAGGEYGTGKKTGEVYDPLSNTWTMTPVSGQSFSDSVSKLVTNGNVLVAPVGPSSSGFTEFYNVATNTWSQGPKLFRGSSQDEASWVKLPDDSIITIDPFGTNSERYIPASNTWVNDSVVPVSLYDPFGSELGAAFLLPDGRTFFLGSTGHTAFYTPSGTTSPGTWAAGPDIPNAQGTPDAAAAMMVNGVILCAVSPIPTSANHFPTPTSFYEFDYSTNIFTQVNAPTGTTQNNPSYFTTMLCLPDGTILHSHFNSQLFVYTPGSSPLAAGKPAITGITQNADASFHLTGTLLNGISEGAAYGDDWQMNTNYPIVRMTGSTGNVYYARTYSWSSTSVMTGSLPMSTEFTLPAGIPADTYSVVVTANGNASDPVSLDVAPILVTVPVSATEGSAPVNGSVTLPSAPASDTTVNLVSNLTARATVPTSVTVLAGQITATFQVTIINDALLNGNQATTISASASGYQGGSSNIIIVDNESATISVTPSTAFNPSGSIGGPFTPSSITYTVTNTGNISLNWSVSKAVSWLTLSTPTSGTLTAGSNVMVTVSTNTTTNTEALGSYTDTIVFDNTTNGSGNAGRAVTLSVAPPVPVLSAMPAYTKGTSHTFSWTASTGATSYSVQASTSATFATIFSTQTPATPTATFTGLTSGTLYYYRTLASANTINSAYSNIVSSTQDNTAPVIAITTPAPGLTYSTTHSSVVVQGTASDTISGLSTVTVNSQTATTSDSFAHWSATVPLASGANTITATAADQAQTGGNTSSASLSVNRSNSTQNDDLPDAWKIAHGLDPNSSAAVNGPTGDPDHDGIPNVLEYAFNTDPQAPTSIPGTSSIQINPADSLPYLQLAYVRRIGALDLTYTAEVSDDLLTWSSPGGMVQQLSVTANGDGVTETVTVRINAPVNSTPKKFAHVKVSSF